MPFLPITKDELDNKEADFILVTGDAYVDHPSFGAAIISRLLVSHGFSVAILAQPNWRSVDDFMRFGRPRLGFLVTGGNIDSMVNHYTVSLHKRKEDAYAPGGMAGLRPNRASIVYSNMIRQAYKDVPIILGGLEASLRRLAHYDYWDNVVRRSILLDSSADLLVYGMGENQMVAIAEALASGISVCDITFIEGTVFKTRDISFIEDPVMLPEFKSVAEATSASKKAYCQSFMLQYYHADYLTAKNLIEPYPNVYVVQNKPARALTTSEIDRVYALPFMRDYHPVYQPQGGVPAIEEVKFSIASTRGCFGGCHFCSLNFHQGRAISARSHKSILAEAQRMTHDPAFKGYIHDVGGPTANFRRSSCDRWERASDKPCRRQCLVPEPCPRLRYDHQDYLTLLQALRNIPKIKKVFVRSGIRYDYLMHDPKGDHFLQELCAHHVSGRLKVAPEHIADHVLDMMGKPHLNVYQKFSSRYAQVNQKLEKDQYLVPYLMSSHPSSNLMHAIELAEYLQSTGQRPEQVQDFYPTPATLSTCMYYTGYDPRTMQKVFVAKSQRDKTTQRALIQYRLPANYDIVKTALLKAGRKDLIGHHPQALLRPRKATAEHSIPKTPRTQTTNSRKTGTKKNDTNSKNSQKLVKNTKSVQKKGF